MMKKSYNKFAEAIRTSRAEAKKASPQCQLGVEFMASKIASILQLENRNFDYKKFNKACGYE